MTVEISLGHGTHCDINVDESKSYPKYMYQYVITILKMFNIRP